MRYLSLLIFMVLFGGTSVHAIELNNTNLSGIAEAHGFVIGQNLSLDRISESYPELSREAFLAKLSFERTFGDIPGKLEPMFEEALGSDGFGEYRADIESQLRSQVDSTSITRSQAELFLEEVHSRAKGDIYSPTLEYLLAIRFGDNPVEEYTKGFRQKYQTDGSGKSRGVVLDMQLPRSWQGKEGNRPHIVRKWQSDAGTGSELVMLMVRDTQGVHISRADVAELMQPGEVDEMVPEGGVLEDHGMVTVEEQPGYFMDFGLVMERSGVVVYQKMRQYAFFYRDKMVAVQCSSVRPESQYKEVEEDFEWVKPLCTQVFNSVVIPDNYLNPMNDDVTNRPKPGI